MTTGNVPQKKSRTQKNSCFARRHMKPGVHSFYSYAYRVASHSGVFWSHARRDGREFSVSKNTVTGWIRFLVAQGWFVCLDKGSRKRSAATGQMQSVRYRVLDHDEWAALYPGRCFFAQPVPKTGTGNIARETAACPTFCDSPVPLFGHSPVPKSGTKTVEVDSSKSKTEPFIAFAQQPECRLSRTRDLPKIDAHQLRHFWKEAREKKWTRREVTQMLRQHFAVESVSQLTISDYATAVGLLNPN